MFAIVRRNLHTNEEQEICSLYYKDSAEMVAKNFNQKHKEANRELEFYWFTKEVPSVIERNN